MRVFDGAPGGDMPGRVMPGGDMPGSVMTRRGVSRVCWLALTFAALAASVAKGHEIDTGYVTVEAEADSAQLAVTFDVVDLDRALGLDRDRNGEVDASEIESGRAAIERFALETATASFDGVDLRVTPRAFDYATDPTGHLLVRVTARGPHPGEQPSDGPAVIAVRSSAFESFGSGFKVLVRLTAGIESREQVLTSGAPSTDLVLDAERVGGSRSAGGFLKLGVEHIWIGIDHILFLVALLLVGGRFLDLLKIVTAFTLAHSVTLALAATRVITPPSAFIESVIALSIVYVAVENIARKKIEHRWVITALFGLVHGFGFANVLRELSLPTQGFVSALLLFNLGVEIGQVSIVALLWPLILLIGRISRGDVIRRGLSLVVALIGLGWFLERAFGLELGMP